MSLLHRLANQRFPATAMATMARSPQLPLPALGPQMFSHGDFSRQWPMDTPIHPSEMKRGEMPLMRGDLRGILSWLERPWLMSPKRYLQANPHDPHLGTSTSRGEAFDALPDDMKVWLFHATGDDAAEQFLRHGVQQSGKPMTLGRSQFEAGEASRFAPGSGLGEGLYVGASPASIEGYGRRILAMLGNKGNVTPSPEQMMLGARSPGQAIGVSDAMLMGNVPANRILDLSNNRYVFGHEGLVRAAHEGGARIPSSILDEYGLARLP